MCAQAALPWPHSPDRLGFCQSPTKCNGGQYGYRLNVQRSVFHHFAIFPFTQSLVFKKFRPLTFCYFNRISRDYTIRIFFISNNLRRGIGFVFSWRRYFTANWSGSAGCTSMTSFINLGRLIRPWQRHCGNGNSYRSRQIFHISDRN